MLEGKCPNCGASFYGWALKNPQHQWCEVCGARLEIGEENGRNSTDHPNFNSQKFAVRFPHHALPTKAA